MKHLSSLALLILALTPVAGGASFDWPRYLGPDSNGIVKGEVRTDWKSKPPKLLWKTEIGRGCSSFAVAGGKAVTIGNADNTDTVWCFDATTGKVIWKHQYAEKLAPKYYDGGPSSTPNIDGNRIYTMSKSGKLHCLDLANGKPVWVKDLKKDFGGKPPTWGYAASPVVDGSLLYVLPCSKDGAFFALDKATGGVRWNTKDQRKSGYCTPVIAKIGGKKAVIVFYGREVVAYDLESNDRKVLFEHGWRTSYDVNASNPQYYDGKLFIASGYGKGYAVLDVSGAEPKVLHNEEDTRLIFQNSLLTDGKITAVFGDKNLDAELMRMDMASGKILWKVKLPGSRGSCALIGESLIALTETGDLVCGTASDRGFRETGRVNILPRSDKAWAPLAVADGKVFARTNKGIAVCVEVKP